MTFIIGLAGRAGDGKSTAADYLRKKYAGVRTYAFADDLKTLCAKAYPEAPASAWFGSQEEKERSLPELGGLSGRDVQKRIGGAAKEVWGRDFWVERVKEKISFELPDVAVLSDVRFKQEAEFIRWNGGFVWRLENPGRTSDADPSHPSEAGYWSLPHDTHVRAESLDELYLKLDALALGALLYPIRPAGPL